MKTFMAFPICSLIFITLVSVVYFSKPRIKSIENSIYKWLIICNIFGLILEILCYFAVDTVTNFYLISMLILKLYVVYIFIWSIIFNVYVFIVSHKDYNKNDNSLNLYFNKLKKITLGVSLVASFIMLMLPIEIFNDGNLTYTYGPITNFLLVLCFIVVSLWIFKCITHYKDLKQKRYIPIIACVIILTLVLLIQSYDRAILIATTGHSFIVLLMFFTIENPDVKMIDELNKNRLLVNQTVEEKSNFLFLASTEIKNPIKDILDISTKTISLDDKEEIKENVKVINNLSHSLNFIVDNVMDTRTMDINTIKVVNTKYNLVNLVNKIKLLVKEDIDENVEFRINLSPNIPKYLYGDSSLLEQVIVSILKNAAKYTKTGFIEFNINTIVKYDMCRLLIDISDSGVGISIDKVNDLLMIDEDLKEKDLKRLETKDVDINTIKKIVKKMGGYFTLKSELLKGTEIKVVIDQMIDRNVTLNVDNYFKEEKVLVASSDIKFLNRLNKLIDKKGYQVENSIYANDVLDRIRLNQEFSMIILDDNLDKRALEILNLLKKNKKFKTQVMVILDETTINIKEHFIKDGFTDYLDKNNIVKEIDRIFKV